MSRQYRQSVLSARLTRPLRSDTISSLELGDATDYVAGKLPQSPTVIRSQSAEKNQAPGRTEP